MKTLADVTTDEIREALADALSEGNMSAAASLIVALATRAPHEAELIVALLDARRTPNAEETR